jgi:23S rRNA (cytidine1920-2'-O)/16S rRNA (cytidine1409-2'-O)-methyltransferase
MKDRLDRLLVERGLFPSREKARAAILAGDVRVGGEPAYKPSLPVSRDAEISVRTKPRYVSRGGDKLEAALGHFRLSPQGWVCLDVGSSTGGFTDCLLQHGAQEVVAVDVGRGQLHWRIRSDPRVRVLEGVNARYLRREDFPRTFDFGTVDVSFISLRLILPSVFPLIRPGGLICALLKPQFEVGPKEVGKGGVLRDEQIRQRVIQTLRSWLTHQETPWREKGLFPSPILGAKGNQEYFWLLEQALD